MAVDSEIVRFQLVLVRSLLDRASTAAREPTELGSITSLLLADMAVETCFKVVLAVRAPLAGREARTGELAEQVRKACPDLEAGDMAIARRLREARNEVQHAGAAYHSAAVRGHLSDAARLLEHVVRVAFGRELSEISVASLVQNELLRLGLSATLASLDAGELAEAELRLAATFEVLRLVWNRTAREAWGENTKLDNYLPVSINRIVLAVFEMLPVLAEPRTHKETRSLSLSTLGLSVGEVLRLRRAVERVDARIRKKEAQHPPAEAPELRSLVEAVARAVWHIESTQPEVIELWGPWLTPLPEPVSTPAPAADSAPAAGEQGPDTAATPPGVPDGEG